MFHVDALLKNCCPLHVLPVQECEVLLFFIGNLLYTLAWISPTSQLLWDAFLLLFLFVILDRSLCSPCQPGTINGCSSCFKCQDYKPSYEPPHPTLAFSKFKYHDSYTLHISKDSVKSGCPWSVQKASLRISSYSFHMSSQYDIFLKHVAPILADFAKTPNCLGGDVARGRVLAQHV